MICDICKKNIVVGKTIFEINIENKPFGHIIYTHPNECAKEAISNLFAFEMKFTISEIIAKKNLSISYIN